MEDPQMIPSACLPTSYMLDFGALKLQIGVGMPQYQMHLLQNHPKIAICLCKISSNRSFKNSITFM